MPINHTWTHFYCHLNSDPGAGITTFSFRVNGVPVGTPCSFDAGNSANVTSSYPVTAGDRIAVQLTDTVSNSSVHASWAMN